MKIATGFLCVLGFKTGPRDPPSASGIENPTWLKKTIVKKSSNKKGKPKKNMVWSASCYAILCDSTVVVVRTRPRAIPLAMITMFPFVAYMGMGLRLAAPPELRYEFNKWRRSSGFQRPFACMNDPKTKQLICTRGKKLFLHVFFLRLRTEHILKPIKLVTYSLTKLYGLLEVLFSPYVAPR